MQRTRGGAISDKSKWKGVPHAAASALPPPAHFCSFNYIQKALSITNFGWSTLGTTRDLYLKDLTLSGIGVSGRCVDIITWIQKSRRKLRIA